MSIKKIGIIYSDLHPLIIKAAEYIKKAGISAEMIHWQSITYNGTQSNIDNFSVIYLDRMGELTRSYATQIRALQLGCNVPVVNHPESYWSARDKGLAAFSLRAAGILTPPDRKSVV